MLEGIRRWNRIRLQVRAAGLNAEAEELRRLMDGADIGPYWVDRSAKAARKAAEATERVRLAEA